MTILIVARHGNTFEDGEIPRRVGVRTDLPLTRKGQDQARASGRHLKESGLLPDAVYTSHLKRTKETASLAIETAGLSLTATPLAIFNEIDYGPDENKTDAAVIARIGETALKEWDKNGIVPQGWKADPAQIIENWQDFGAWILREYPQKTVLAVTSNGIARFAPYLTGDFEGFLQEHKIKIATGALCILSHEDSRWIVREWGIKP